MRERFKLAALIHAAVGLFGFRKDIAQLAPEPAPHDEFHHERNSHSRGTGRAFARKRRRHRNVKNEMAFQSRKRNRAWASHKA